MVIELVRYIASDSLQDQMCMCLFMKPTEKIESLSDRCALTRSGLNDSKMLARSGPRDAATKWPEEHTKLHCTHVAQMVVMHGPMFR